MLAVLIVDEMLAVRSALLNLLKNAGVQRIHTANDGRSALQAFENNAYDAIFLNLELTDVNGLALLDDFIKRSPSTKIYICTGSNELGELKAALDAGADGFIVKPYTTQKVFSIVSSLQHLHDREVKSSAVSLY